jgi:hypothetical protein
MQTTGQYTPGHPAERFVCEAGIAPLAAPVVP